MKLIKTHKDKRSGAKYYTVEERGSGPSERRRAENLEISHSRLKINSKPSTEANGSEAKLAEPRLHSKGTKGSFEGLSKEDILSSQGLTEHKSRSRSKQAGKQANKSSAASLMDSAVRMLAMREHSEQELRQKLQRRTDQHALVDEVIESLAHQGLQSDRRFCESFVRSSIQRGHGPVKIQQSLRTRGVADSLVHDYLNTGSVEWLDIAKDCYTKKYGSSPVKDYKEWSKRARFMQNRGFNTEQIRTALPEIQQD